MEVLLEKSTPTNATLTVKLSKEDYQPKVDKTIKDYSRRVNLKGFRPGKVPPQVIQRMYGKSIVVDEVNNLLSDTVNTYIRDNKLSVVGDPQINEEKTSTINWDKQTDFEFEYELGLASDFEVNIDSIQAINKYTIEAGDKEIDEAIENLRERFAEQSSVETSQTGDMLFGELKEVNGDFSTKTAIPFSRIKEEAQAKFVGVNKGEAVTFDIRDTFAEERAIALVTGLKDDAAAALNGDFALIIEDITRKVPAEIGQAFFDKVLGEGKATDKADFRKQLGEIIQDNYKRESESLLRYDIESALMNEIQIDLPEQFLKNWLLKLNADKFTAEEIEKEYPQFAKSMKWGLIKNKLADQLEVKVEPNEIIDATEAMVKQQFGMYGNDLDPQMQETIRKIAMNYLMDKEKDNYTTTFNNVLNAKVLDALKEKVTLTEKTIDVEQFKEIANAVG